MSHDTQYKVCNPSPKPQAIVRVWVSIIRRALAIMINRDTVVYTMRAAKCSAISCGL